MTTGQANTIATLEVPAHQAEARANGHLDRVRALLAAIDHAGDVAGAWSDVAQLAGAALAAADEAATAARVVRDLDACERELVC